jgi:hypothetical protein
MMNCVDVEAPQSVESLRKLEEVFFCGAQGWPLPNEDVKKRCPPSSILNGLDIIEDSVNNLVLNDTVEDADISDLKRGVPAVYKEVRWKSFKFDPFCHPGMPYPAYPTCKNFF